jgi:hypothetical protein
LSGLTASITVRTLFFDHFGAFFTGNSAYTYLQLFTP